MVSLSLQLLIENGIQNLIYLNYITVSFLRHANFIILPYGEGESEGKLNQV